MKELLIPLASIPLFIVEDFTKLSETEYINLVNLEEKLSGGGGENYISVNRQILELDEFKDLKYYEILTKVIEKLSRIIIENLYYIFIYFINLTYKELITQINYLIGEMFDMDKYNYLVHRC
jgi:hypothetical protein